MSSPSLAQFLETRRFQLEEIARIYRVPLHLVGDLEHATFSNIEHQSLSFVKFTLMPWVRRLEQGFEMALLPPSEQSRIHVKFSVEGLLRGNYKSRMDGYAVGIQNGFMSPNDVRRLENLNLIPDPSGDKFYFNGNMLPIDMAGQQYVKKGEETNGTDKK
ncbi:hypothetical protein FACS189499_08620 [Clostridia bacterium]|nr:hypothetical protein FACS189499_08620 [Clostridia bacterium]